MLVVQAGRRTEKLGPLGVRRLGDLYRSTAADLALARRAFPGDPLVVALEQRVGRARYLVYGAHTRRTSALAVLQARLLAGDTRAAGAAADRDRAARRLGRDLGRVGRPRPGRGGAAGSVGVSRGHAAPAARLRPRALALRAQRDVEPDLHQQHPRDPGRARCGDRVRRRLGAGAALQRDPARRRRRPRDRLRERRGVRDARRGARDAGAVVHRRRGRGRDAPRLVVRRAGPPDPRPGAAPRGAQDGRDRRGHGAVARAGGPGRRLRHAVGAEPGRGARRSARCWA